MTRRVTQRDVAAHAGVSRSLVSLVIQGAEHVSNAKRRAVEQSMQDLGYRPNAAARNLGRRTHTIGVMVQDLHYPFFAEVIDGIQAAAGESGLQVLINTGLRTPSVEEAAIETFLELRMDGIVLISPSLPDEAIIAAARYLPVVLVSRPLNDPSVDVVRTDDITGGKLATEHLIAHGHTRILHVGPRAEDENAGSIGRRQGYREALAQAGLSDYERVVDDGDDVASAARGSVDDPEAVTAVFAHNDFIAVDVWARIEADRPGDPLAVVGFDNTNFSGLPQLSLTSVDQPRIRLGRIAVDMIDERISGREESWTEVLEPTLVVRASSTT